MKIQKALFVYKLYMMLYLLVAFNGFLNSGYLLKAGTVVAAVFGVILLCYILLHWKDYRKMPNFILCILFLASYVLSSVLNIKYGIMENIQALLWLTCQIVILYIGCYRYTSESIRNEVSVLTKVYVAWCVISNIISLSMIFWGVEYAFENSQGQTYWMGYMRNRLWGVYNDPNHGAVITVIAILASLYLWKNCKKNWQKIGIVFSVIVNVLYIGFSNSRTAMIALGGGLMCWSFLSLYAKKKRVGKAILISLVIALVSVAELSAFEAVNVQVYKYAQAGHMKKHGIQPESGKKKDKRKQELEKDSSNGRISIWESGIEIAKTSPVYGVSFRNIVPYAEAKLPETYIVNNPVVNYDSLHNMFVDVLVSQGVIGIIITLLLIGNTVYILIKNISHIREKEYDVAIFCFTIMVSMIFASQFYSYVFYLHAPQTFAFWGCMGYLVRLSKPEENEITKEL